eukprot:NODE_5344_length_584_cov_36.970093_g4632_i0.p1 GENE.NODE_5344_length_584_cov_36.970093_g4632_i0~~NODE_5344_length_584_cov_36.970093_g4632_i0.p1  ORF type:complete len:159 (+),score=25.83 NODE_5344_length_584_cov_36.970093_g4632_i0:30-506(+)
MSDDEYGQGDAGANLTYPLSAGNIKKNCHVMIKEHPCKVSEVSVSKTGKHGHAKANVTGYDIFTGKKYEDVFPTSHNVDAPFMNKVNYEVVDYDQDDGSITYMDAEGDVKDDLTLTTDQNEELSDTLAGYVAEDKSCQVTVLQAMGKEQVVEVKTLLN